MEELHRRLIGGSHILGGGYGPSREKKSDRSPKGRSPTLAPKTMGKECFALTRGRLVLLRDGRREQAVFAEGRRREHDQNSV